jgi:hypothetical protein
MDWILYNAMKIQFACRLFKEIIQDWLYYIRIIKCLLLYTWLLLYNTATYSLHEISFSEAIMQRYDLSNVTSSFSAIIGFLLHAVFSITIKENANTLS